MQLSAALKKRLLNRYGPWALITGASSGIGLELARQLASAGFHLVLNARGEKALQQVCDELKAAHGIQALPLAADAATPEGIAQLTAVSESYPIGLLLLSAGFGTSGAFLNSTADAEAQLLRVNCEAVMRLTHFYGNRFAANGKGGIVLLSSMVGFQGVPNAASYAATKAYVQTLAEGIYHELKPLGVDVLAAAPGPVASGFGKRANMIMNGAMRPDQVGVPILRALGRTSTVFPGTLTKVLVYSLRTVPRSMKVRILKLVMGGMTKHQQATR